MKNPMSLAGKAILVTGASAGIGQSTSILLSELGAVVTLVGRNESRLQQTLPSLSGGGHRVSLFDLQSTEAIAGWFSQLVAEQGPFDGLVHCAGTGPMIPIRMFSSAEAENVMRINVLSAMALTQAFAHRKAHQPKASIVFVASVAGLAGVAARTTYSASKGALIAFARSAAMELARSGMRVNCVAPAYVETAMFEESLKTMTADQIQNLIQTTQPLGLGSPLDVAHAIAFLLAETGRWITGSVLTVDGGYTAQ
jgi:3-oxoacyl-[acyl-carrier protein] reductase